MLLQRNGLARRRTRHNAPSAMRTGAEALGIAQATHDVRTCAHRAWNDAHYALRRVRRAFTCYQDVLAKVMLTRRPRMALRPCGTACSIAACRAARLSGNCDAVSSVRTAIMPQPTSIPTAAGMIVPRVGVTEPIVYPSPTCTAGITATCLKMNCIDAVFNS
jgi:hypothetical protein